MHHYSVINTLCVIWTCIYLTQAQEPKQIFPSALKEEMYSQCGGVLKEPRGVLSTPNFPNPYPVPIRCRWIIEAPADRVIALYFSQFYMREGVTVIEYAFYSDTLHMGEKELGSVSSDHQPTFLVSNKPVLVLDFLVRESSNVHLRVREYLLDVFGFNITYEIVGRNESARKDACIYDHCSYSGSCFASVEFAGYACHCFGGHYGEECQYSPGCEPGSESTCLNGGTCR
ncbi:hypothetical protein JTE90_007200 [Oedothorax gibbosus]|uniref:Uncharacterized protein n=1 Tax=Oedothorax gibbosus TaxID=931172 RepID=A0AAV6UBZ5_9ARAC|nr:hypothetical protein JTE90_007200 [Oedothorax gibbosus]